MGLWHVIYEDWQMECCGTPFGTGDEVSWPLLLEDADHAFGGGWHDQLTEAAGLVEEAGGVRLLREESGLTVAVGADPDDEEDRHPKPGDRIRSIGLLSAERHGAVWPEVAGRVRAVQVLTQAYAESAAGSRTWEPVAGRRRLRLVDRCPKWFADGGEGDRGLRWKEAGVMVTLEVPHTDSRLSHAVREARGIPRQGGASGAETKGLSATGLTALLESLSTVAVPPGSRERTGRRGG
ncbi:DUF6578 domain-containing protein [Streptomyces sp. NPDC019990]|uniref:DUF6578 domain-containing protein n=1 Tax=Streptomyces sp. NPDC019990 TaxID=3154693 RepID=UPI0033D52849